MKIYKSIKDMNKISMDLPQHLQILGKIHRIIYSESIYKQDSLIIQNYAFLGK